MIGAISKRVVLFVALAVGSAHANEAAQARGAELLLPFKKELKSALLAGLEQGPVEAISVCREQAPEIADSLMQDGIRLGRSSHRLRNPGNVAPDWVEPLMQEYLDDGENRGSSIVALAEDKWGYAEPIITQPLCLTCHGDAVPPVLAERIEELYPEDQAVGFEAGELRGVFWLEFPMSDASPEQP